MMAKKPYVPKPASSLMVGTITPMIKLQSHTVAVDKATPFARVLFEKTSAGSAVLVSA